jgi:hypothetical protein
VRRLSWHAPRQGMLAFNPQTRCNVSIARGSLGKPSVARASQEMLLACDPDRDCKLVSC